MQKPLFRLQAKFIVSAALTAAIAAPVSTAALAEGWSGTAEAGAISTSGNSDNTSITSKVDISRDAGGWIHNILADAYNAETDGDKTADRFSLGYKPKKLLNESTYLFGLGNYDTDDFANIDDRKKLVAGVGHWFINQERTELLGEAGIGARSTDFISGGESSDDGIIYLYGKYRQSVLENADFIATVAIDGGGDNTFTDASVGLQVGLGGALALKVSHSLRRNSDIVGIRGDKSDSVTGVTLVYGLNK